MRVAVKFSAKLGHKLSFDELSEPLEGSTEKIDNNLSCSKPSSLTIDAKSESATISINSNNNSCNNNSSNNSKSYNNNNSSDDDSDDFEAYSIVEPSSVPTVSYYLRDCLENLQSPDSKPESYELHKKALISIPIIISNNPHDAKYNCAELTRELLRFRNSFNIENFDGLRDQALLQILVSYPSLSIPTVIQSIEDPDSYSIGVKLAAIVSLCKASYILAGSTPPGGDDRLGDAEKLIALATVDGYDKSKIGGNNIASGHQNKGSSNLMQDTLTEETSKTKIKRPLLLAAR
jgi:hypothetical protein